MLFNEIKRMVCYLTTKRIALRPSAHALHASERGTGKNDKCPRVSVGKADGESRLFHKKFHR